MPTPEWHWASPGAIVATVVFLLASMGFSIYNASFGNYNQVYGALGAVVVLMLWLFLTVYSVILGAELNVEPNVRHRDLGAPSPEVGCPST